MTLTFDLKSRSHFVPKVDYVGENVKNHLPNKADFFRDLVI